MSSLINMLISLIPLAAVAIFRVCCRIKTYFLCRSRCLPGTVLSGTGHAACIGNGVLPDIQFPLGCIDDDLDVFDPLFLPDHSTARNNSVGC